MRSTIIKRAAGSTLLLAFILQACTKESSTRLTTQADFSNSSLIRVFIATVNASRNYIYLDTKPLNGSALASGGIFPASGVYASNIPPGLNGFLVRDTLTATFQVPLSFAENMQVNKNYTIFMYDTITTPKQKTVETRFVTPENNSSRIRFANFTYSPNAIPAVDIFSKKNNANIFTNVQVTDVSDFIPYTSDVTDTFYIRQTGTGINLQNYVPPVAPATVGTFVNIFVALTPRAKRSYTLVFRGGFRATTSTAATVRTLSVFTDY